MKDNESKNSYNSAASAVANMNAVELLRRNWIEIFWHPSSIAERETAETIST